LLFNPGVWRRMVQSGRWYDTGRPLSSLRRRSRAETDRIIDRLNAGIEYVKVNLYRCIDRHRRICRDRLGQIFGRAEAARGDRFIAHVAELEVEIREGLRDGTAVAQGHLHTQGVAEPGVAAHHQVLAANGVDVDDGRQLTAE